MAVHSRFGGSVIDQVIHCPGSPALKATVPKKPGGLAADMGIAAHALGEECLKTSTDPEDHRGEFFPRKEDQPDRSKAFIAEDEMIRCVKVYVDAVRAELALTPDAELYVEQEFVIDVDTADPGEVHGKTDAMVYHPSTGRLRQFDYKHGTQPVSAEDSRQLKFYAVGAVFSKPWKLSEVILTIVQPRARDVEEAGVIKDWPMDVLDLLEFKDEIEAAVGAAKASDAPLVAHPDGQGWCRWCDAAAACPAREQAVLAAAKLEFASVKDITVADLPAPKTFDLGDISEILRGLGLVSAWMNQIQEYVEGLVLGGTPVPGWKAVEKIGRTKWVESPTEIVAYADAMFSIPEDLMSPRKLATLTEAEKLLKSFGATKEQIDDFKLKFTIKESSGLTIAPESDRRPAVDAVARDFGALDTTAFSGT